MRSITCDKSFVVVVVVARGKSMIVYYCTNTAKLHSKLITYREKCCLQTSREKKLFLPAANQFAVVVVDCFVVF